MIFFFLCSNFYLFKDIQYKNIQKPYPKLRSLILKIPGRQIFSEFYLSIFVEWKRAIHASYILNEKPLVFKIPSCALLFFVKMYKLLHRRPEEMINHPEISKLLITELQYAFLVQSWTIILGVGCRYAITEICGQILNRYFKGSIEVDIWKVCR